MIRVVLARIRGILHNTRDWEEARALAQDVFVKAWQAIASLQKPENFLGWILTIADNESRMVIRTKMHRPAVSTLSEEDRTETPEPGPEREAESGEIRRALDEALADFPEAHREVILLKTVAGLGCAEISGKMGMSYDQAKGILARGLTKVAMRMRSFAPGKKQ